MQMVEVQFLCWEACNNANTGSAGIQVGIKAEERDDYGGNLRYKPNQDSPPKATARAPKNIYSGGQKHLGIAGNNRSGQAKKNPRGISVQTIFGRTGRPD
jgi:hypothetical protein